MVLVMLCHGNVCWVQVDTAVKELQARLPDDAAPSAMLSHSAGGWLARVYLQDFGTTGFDRLISLGSPHLPPRGDARGIVDQTRGILTFLDDTIPGCYHGEVSVAVCAATSFVPARCASCSSGTTLHLLPGKHASVPTLNLWQQPSPPK